MNLNNLFEMQHELDAKIQSQHHLESESLIDRKILALLVEVAELANETRCFKFWSLKEPSAIEVILEEYVDGIHFILSLGLELEVCRELQIKPELIDCNLNEQFLTVFQTITIFQSNISLENYRQVIIEYLLLGKLLGFSEEDIESAYVSKNEINHERQQQGY
ncbi:dUTP diphosphatase [Metabacillus herbersteinensis]|uniref:dUTP diphosphatase n=1 Tax=Metabacillus herbersteinensis TaxID=283816 RepID=A0ABV6G991_9BACI